ncbi:hypothetical protein BpHYR1_005026 [Brachionus plicatilis]|uniref:Uncharacterized protein n=1 Tax=Brachionus plicatilis TaxID=10195 RepID=A0A3M7PVC0_BRAPC|nr:hypothetical protein BpHYR1_005026 [Brachionus plicatilis]
MKTSRSLELTYQNKKLLDFSLFLIYITVFPRSILQPQNPKHNFDAGNKHHLANMVFIACVKVVFRVLRLQYRTREYGISVKQQKARKI